MADGKYERLVELRSRLPHVSDTVISYFLSKYENVEECYEKLRSGYEETADNTKDIDPRLLNPSHHYTPSKSYTNSNRRSWDRDTSPSGQGWYEGPAGQSHGGRHVSPSRLPYPAHHQDSMPSPNDSRNLDYELIADQRDQVAFMDKERMGCARKVEELRREVDMKRQRLTQLRIRVSDCPTKLDVTGIQDIITTLEDDVLVYRNKVEVAQQQSVMKKNLDMYTEEGVRWDCKHCKFLNHPLMSRCENCDKNR